MRALAKRAPQPHFSFHCMRAAEPSHFFNKTAPAFYREGAAPHRQRHFNKHLLRKGPWTLTEIYVRSYYYFLNLILGDGNRRREAEAWIMLCGRAVEVNVFVQGVLRRFTQHWPWSNTQPSNPEADTLPLRYRQIVLPDAKCRHLPTFSGSNS